jgi:hypothetical protein
MSVLKNFVLSVSKRDGQVIPSVVSALRKLFGFAAKTVFHLKTCANSQKKMSNNLLKKEYLFTDIIWILFGVNFVIETYQVWVSWIINSMVTFVIKRHVTKEKWIEMTGCCKNAETYKALLTQMFLDKNYSYGRLFVLILFTKDICENNPVNSNEIQKIFFQFIRQNRFK